MNKSIKMVVLFFIIWITLHSIYICIIGLNDSIKKSDCILILGNRINEDGTLSNRLQSRVDKGFELYQSKISNKIIVSGGLDKTGFYEASEMRNYLLKKGVKPSDIITDTLSLTTYETMINYSNIAKQNEFNSTIIVSQFFHIHRSKAMLESLSIQNNFHAHASYFELKDIYYILREFVAYYSFAIKNTFNNLFTKS